MKNLSQKELKEIWNEQSKKKNSREVVYFGGRCNGKKFTLLNKLLEGN